MKKTESQRRDEVRSGSNMVKLHKPFPELKPRNANIQLRKTFNQNWMQEKRRAAMEHLKQQSKQVRQSAEPDYVQPRGYEWGD